MRNSFMQPFYHLRHDSHLPSLRRFAEAMSGCRDIADIQMAAVIDRLATDTAALPAASSTKVGLFKLYAGMCPLEQSAQARLRQVLLLVLMAGFSKKETAEILDVAMAEVVTILKSASCVRTDRIGTHRPSYRPLRASLLEGGKEAGRQGRIDRHVQ